MTVHTAEAVAHEERRYLQVFLLLGILTVLEISVIYMPLPRIAIAGSLVMLAATKAALVALYYMHLINERRILGWIALTPAILCVFLLFMLLPDLGAITRLLAHAMVAATPAGH